MIVMPALKRTVLVLSCAMTGWVQAATTTPAPLTVPVQETQLVAASTAAATTQVSFTIASAEDLTVTLTDLQVPAELTSAGVVVTQAGAIVGSGQLTNPATNASISIAQASGAYTLYVFGVPGASYSVGSFSVCVAPKSSPANCIQAASTAGLISAPNSSANPAVSTLSTTLNVATADSYTFNFADLSFPIALASQPQVALFQGSTPIIPPGQSSPGITAGTSLSLSPGTYTLLSIAQADPNVQEGLYSLNVVSSGGVSVLPNGGVAVPVGLLPAAGTYTNTAAQNLTLTVSDYGFPGPLTSASALVTANGVSVGSASAAGGAQTLAAPAGTLSIWTYGAAGGTPGTFSADLSVGGSDLYTTAAAVNPSGTTSFAYAYVVPVTTAGAYQSTATDLQFPAQLGSLSFAVAQNGATLQTSKTAGTVNFNLVAGNAIVLASAAAPASSSSSGSTTSASGLFDVNIQSSGAAATLLFDKTQNVSATPSLFNSQTLSVTDSASYDVTLADLKFPTAFDSLALIVTRGSQVLGKVFGAGPLSFTSTPGNYLLTFVASPSADQQFGLYGLSVAYSPPTVSLTSSAASAATGSSITLSFSSTNATSCTASGGWTGTEPTSSTTVTETISATTTYTLTCTGAGGSASQSVTVTATAAPTSSHHGGGALDWSEIAALLGVVVLRIGRNRRQEIPA